MSCNCNTQVQSWYDLPVVAPIDPREVIANVSIGLPGTFKLSTNFLQTAWGPPAIAFTVIPPPSCASLRTDNFGSVSDAAQWTMAHQIINLDANIPPSLQRVAFMRGGTDWEMVLGLNFGAATYDNLQLSFRENAATSGKFLNTGSGAIPVFSFANTYTLNQIFRITFKQFGRYSLALVMRDTYSGVWSMFEIECIVEN